MEGLPMEHNRPRPACDDGIAGDRARRKSARTGIPGATDAQSKFDCPLVCRSRFVESLEDCLAAELLRPLGKLTKTTRVAVDSSTMDQFGCAVVQVSELVVIAYTLVFRRRHVQSTEQRGSEPQLLANARCVDALKGRS